MWGEVKIAGIYEVFPRSEVERGFRLPVGEDATVAGFVTSSLSQLQELLLPKLHQNPQKFQHPIPADHPPKLFALHHR